jgi:hypothetical protein
MADLSNTYFDASPLTVRFSVTSPPDDEGWRDFHLAFYADALREGVIASCTEQLSTDDVERLVARLRDIARGAAQTLVFAPTEPSFILRATRRTGADEEQEPDDVEMLWIIDQGAVESNNSTDTGIAIVMVVRPAQIEAFVAELS